MSQPVTDSDYRYIAYWSFYRYNHFLDGASDFEHQGDWEGISIAPSYERPGTFDFASFSAHIPWWSYLRDTLECEDGTVSDTCGTDSDRPSRTERSDRTKGASIRGRRPFRSVPRRRASQWAQRGRAAAIAGGSPLDELGS